MTVVPVKSNSKSPVSLLKAARSKKELPPSTSTFVVRRRCTPTGSAIVGVCSKLVLWKENDSSAYAPQLRPSSTFIAPRSTLIRWNEVASSTTRIDSVTFASCVAPTKLNA